MIGREVALNSKGGPYPSLLGMGRAKHDKRPIFDFQLKEKLFILPIAHDNRMPFSGVATKF
jgi:hypothetical protein